MVSNNDTLVAWCRVQWDASGVGHCWRDQDATDLPPDIRLEIESEIINGNGDCDNYVASNGQHYRWWTPETAGRREET